MPLMFPPSVHLGVLHSVARKSKSKKQASSTHSPSRADPVLPLFRVFHQSVSIPARHSTNPAISCF